MRKILFLSLWQLFLATSCLASGPGGYAVAVIPTPVLNTPDLVSVFGGSDRQTLRRDRCEQLRNLEFVALPGTRFLIESKVETSTGSVYRVTTDDYPYPAQAGYYVDSRFVSLTPVPPPPRPRSLPARNQVLANLLAAEGSRYVWGGNVRAGVPQLLAFFPPAPGHRLTEAHISLWQLQGVDCSGLLYEATGGFTPRNTSALLGFGKAVPVAGLKAEEIAKRLEPLDLIVWNGHVMIVIDGQRLIESRLDCTGRNGGVRTRPLEAALEELLQSRVPANEYVEEVGRRKSFLVRRWYEGRRP